jgi:alpha,alpha-trehalase
MLLRIAIVLTIIIFYNFSIMGKEIRRPVLIDVEYNFKNLLVDEDTDGDNKITIDDQGDKIFEVETISGKTYKIEGTYYLSNLLMQLALARNNSQKRILLRPQLLYENPVSRTSRMIREIFWDGLTRQIDEAHLEQVLSDTKVATEVSYLYVPNKDRDGYFYFSDVAKRDNQLNMRVELLSENITPEFVKSLGDKDGRHGLLSLAIRRVGNTYEGVPFVVPGGRFNEMYGWDSYFINRGLLIDNRIDLAKGMADNFKYELNYYGKILNANRTYYLTRSQPPFFSSMALEVNEYIQDESWLLDALRLAIKEYNEVWTNEPKLTDTRLSRYYDVGSGLPPETEEDHFDWLLVDYAKKYGMTVEQFRDEYMNGKINEPSLDEYFVHDRCMRESGHDTTYRWTVNGVDRCADFVTVDLNSLLYKYELDIAYAIKRYFNGSITLFDGTVTTSDEWYKKAGNRKKLILDYLWDEKSGMFFDYNFIDKTRSSYVSATTFYPLWAINPEEKNTEILSRDQAEKLVQVALKYLEEPGGIAASAKESAYKAGQDKIERQWDYPFGWAPHQMIVWRGLINYGFNEEAHRLIYKWLYTIVKNAADYNGTIPEKYDVVKRSHKVFITYGNVGTEFDYITEEGFGWMNASFQEGLQLLPRSLIDKLKDLTPPEEIF